MRSVKLALSLALAIIAPNVTAIETHDIRPDAAALLDIAYNPPAHSYRGRMMLTRWLGRQTSAEEVNVYFRPPHHYRLEFLTIDGAVQRVVVGSNDGEQIQLNGKPTVTVGRVEPAYLTAQDQKQLLLRNYSVAVTGSEEVLGRRAWVLEMKPVTGGKPTQKVWIDQDSKVILESKRFRQDASVGALTRFTRFEVTRALPDELFGNTLNLGSEVDQPLVSLNDSDQSGVLANAPSQLAGGFALLGTDEFDVQGSAVTQLRYTDGLIPVSLFLTEAPVEKRGGSQLANGSQVTYWTSGRQHYTLMGEVSDDLLQKMKPAIH